MESNTKEVYYHEYCPKCEHYEVEGYQEPCNECLAQSYNYNSHKPINFHETYGGSKREK